MISGTFNRGNVVNAIEAGGGGLENDDVVLFDQLAARAAADGSEALGVDGSSERLATRPASHAL